VHPKVPADTASHISIWPTLTRKPERGMIISEGKGKPMLSKVMVIKTAQKP